MELQCDICFVNFDLAIHRPKSLPCGHTICQECVENPALQRKCPTCRKGLGRNTHNLPDNITVIQIIQQDATPPRKKPRKEDTVVQELQRGVDAGRRMVEQLRQVVPLAVEALNRQLDTSVTQLRLMEETLELLAQLEAAGGEGAPPDLTAQLQLAAQLQFSLRLLSTKKCSVVAEEDYGAAWKASLQPGGVGDLLRLMLLQLQTDGQLEKVGDDAAPATPAAYVGPPMLQTLRIEDRDLDGARLKVNDILRERKRWKNTRSLRELEGEGSEQLLRVLAPQLEELKIKEEVTLKALEEVQKMASLRRLEIVYKKDVDAYPSLPLQLEELEIDRPCETQLRSVERMPWLRSLYVWNYLGPDVAFAPSRHGALRWLGISFNAGHKTTMLSLIRCYSSSLQELLLLCSVSDEGAGLSFYFPDLGEDLAASGLPALRRLVLRRPAKTPCADQVAACLLQRQALRSALPASVEVLCTTCNVAEV